MVLQARKDSEGTRNEITTKRRDTPIDNEILREKGFLIWPKNELEDLDRNLRLDPVEEEIIKNRLEKLEQNYEQILTANNSETEI